MIGYLQIVHDTAPPTWHRSLRKVIALRLHNLANRIEPRIAPPPEPPDIEGFLNRARVVRWHGDAPTRSDGL